MRCLFQYSLKVLRPLLRDVGSVGSKVGMIAILAAPGDGGNSKPHVRTYLYTKPNTRILMSTRMSAVATFAQIFNPESLGSKGLRVLLWEDERRLLASPRANAGKAKLWVKVSLCKDSDKL